MKWKLLCILALSCTAFAGTPPEPYIAEVGEGAFLDLPQQLREELATRYPQFHMFSNSDYIPSLQRGLPRLRIEGVQLLPAVVGDFDGNGLSDVAVIGHVAEQVKLILVLTKPEGYESHDYDRGPFNPHGWLVVNPGEREYGRFDYLTKVLPGKITSHFEEEPLELQADAFEIVWAEKASVLFYWKDGELKRYTTSD